MSGRFKDALPLKVFIRKKQVLGLYRRLLRAGIRADVATGGTGSSDLFQRIRSEFRIHRDMTDSSTISTLITEGTSSPLPSPATNLTKSTHSPPSLIYCSFLHPPGLRHAENIESMADPGTGSATDAAPDSWVNTGDADDPRGRVGTEWPWDQ